MASKRRLRRKMCTRKKRYTTQQEGWNQIWHIRQEKKRAGIPGGQQLHVYKCDFCGGWHIGRKRNQHLAVRMGRGRV